MTGKIKVVNMTLNRSWNSYKKNLSVFILKLLKTVCKMPQIIIYFKKNSQIIGKKSFIEVKKSQFFKKIKISIYSTINGSIFPKI